MKQLYCFGNRDSKVNNISIDICKELKNQENKWGIQNHDPYKWMSILMEEVGEASKAILEQNLENYKEELIQVATVAISAIDSLERNELFV